VRLVEPPKQLIHILPQLPQLPHILPQLPQLPPPLSAHTHTTPPAPLACQKYEGGVGDVFAIPGIYVLIYVFICLYIYIGIYLLIYLLRGGGRVRYSRYICTNICIYLLIYI
jgi:hypothetical protein